MDGVDRPSAARTEPGFVDFDTGLVRLRPLSLADYEWLYRLATSSEVGFRWRLRGATPSLDAFRTELWHGVLAQYVVETSSGSRPIGMVTAYNADHRNGLVYLASLAAPQYFRTGSMPMALEVFADHLFCTWPLRKLMFEIPEYNMPLMTNGTDPIITLESRVEDHVYHNGRYWDMLIGSIGRRRWEKLKNGNRSIGPALARERISDVARKEWESSGSLSLQSFCSMLNELYDLEFDPQPDDLLFDDLAIGSIQVVEILAILLELTGSQVTDWGWAGLGPNTSVRDIHLVLCALSQMPEKTIVVPIGAN